MGRKKKGCLASFVGTVGVVAIIGLAVFAFYQAMAGTDLKEKIETLGKTEEIPYQEVQITEDEMAGKYYYQQLSEEERNVYREIAQGVKESTKEIYVHAADAENTNRLFQFVLEDYPEIFWCDGTASATSYEGQEAYTVLQPVYLYEAEQKEQMKSEIEAGAEECLSQIPQEATEYQKILAVYEYLVNSVDYDLQAENNQNIYSVFVNKRSVCAGYSKATQYLLERLGVFCTYVTGTTMNGQSHAWNLVQCAGDYYYVDTTWGDPVFQSSEEEKQKRNNISYDYMCCSDEELFKTHTIDESASFPACTTMAQNYYVVNGMYYDAYDSQQTLKKMNETISAGGACTVFKYANAGVYREAHDDIFQNLIRQAAQNLASWYGLQQVEYQYVDDGELNKIVIYWKYE